MILWDCVILTLITQFSQSYFLQNTTYFTTGINSIKPVAVLEVLEKNSLWELLKKISSKSAHSLSSLFSLCRGPSNGVSESLICVQISEAPPRYFFPYHGRSCTYKPLSAGKSWTWQSKKCCQTFRGVLGESESKGTSIYIFLIFYFWKL